MWTVREYKTEAFGIVESNWFAILPLSVLYVIKDVLDQTSYHFDLYVRKSQLNK